MIFHLLLIWLQKQRQTYGQSDVMENQKQNPILVTDCSIIIHT